MSAAPKKYNLIQLIGKGSFAKVYKAQHVKSHKIVAIKQIKIDIKGIDGSDFQSILKEVSILLRCNSKYVIKMLDHPYFVQGGNGAYCCLPLEYCSRGSLLKKKCDEASLKKMMHDTLMGMQYLHGNAIIHRDIKPANILIDKSGTFKLADLGIAKYVAYHVAKTQIGSNGYQAPEISEGEGYDSKVDIWSWGVTVRDLAAKKTKAVKALVNGCCQFYPESRPTAKEIFVDLFQKKKSKNQDDQKNDW